MEKTVSDITCENEEKIAAAGPENQARFTIDNLISGKGGKFDLERPKEAFELR